MSNGRKTVECSGHIPFAALAEGTNCETPQFKCRTLDLISKSRGPKCNRETRILHDDFRSFWLSTMSLWCIGSVGIKLH